VLRFAANLRLSKRSALEADGDVLRRGLGCRHGNLCTYYMPCTWAALTEADAFVHWRPPSEAGCLHYSPSQARFVAAAADVGDAVPHFGRPGGVLPRVIENPRT
jgi:hypothetical protein